VPNSVTSRDDEQEHRPGAVLFVYTWDLALAILALFGALAPFAGAVQSSTGAKAIPLAAQVIAAVSSASYEATLIIMTRPRAWVRLTQIGTLGTAIILAAISIAVSALVGNGIGLTALLVTLFFVLLDVLAIVVMTERRVVSWYDQRASIPVYVWATLVLWVGGSLMTIVVSAVLH
jgi:hypothetical protein